MMTRGDAIKALKELQDLPYVELASRVSRVHRKADIILTETLIAAGYPDVVVQYNKIWKRY